MTTRALALAGLLALAAAPAPAPLLAAAPVRPAAATGTVVVPDRFLRRWDPIVVFFERDAGPAAGVPEERPERLVSLEPAHPGAWDWVDRRTLRFRPADPWPPLVRFAVRAGATAVELETLMNPPTAMEPPDGAEGLDPVREAILTFPEPLDAEALARMLSIELLPLPGIGPGPGRLARGDYAVAALERAAPSAPARYAVRFREPVPWGRRAVLRFALSAAGPGGAVAELSFATAEPFRVAAAGPLYGPQLPIAAAGSRYTREEAAAGPPEGRELLVRFNAPVRELGPVEARALVRLTPPVDGLEFSADGAALLVRGPFARDTLYRLDLDPAPITDARGRPLEMAATSTLWFHFPRPAPELRWGAAQGIVERLGPQTVPVEGRGADRVDLRIHRIEPLDRSFWPFPDEPVEVDEGQRPPGPGEEPGPFAVPGQAITPDGLARQIGALGAPGVSAIVELPLRREGAGATFGLDVARHLAFLGGPGAPGHYLVGIRRLDGSTTRSWMRLQATDLALTAVEEPAAVRFAVSSLATGAPVAGARVRVEGWRSREGRTPAWEVLGEGETDAAGLFPWPAPGPEARERRTVRRVVVERGGDLLVLDTSRPPERYADNLWQPGREPWLQWAFETREHDAPPAGLLAHLFTERPLYRPGEEVFIKGYVRRRAHGALAIVPFSGSLVVRGPGGIERRFPVTLSAAGSFHASLREADPPTGEYAARLEGRAGEVLGEVPFRIEAYRLPTFEVLLHGPDRVPLDREFRVDLTATYYAGGRVAARPLLWRVTQFPHAWTPPGLPGFRFSSDGRFSRGHRFESSPALSREDATDGDGAAALVLNPAVEPTAQPRQYVVEATVTGADDQTVTATRRVVALPPFVLGLKAPRHLARAGRIVPQLVAVGPAGEALVGLPVTVRLLRRAWHSVLRAGDFSDGTAKFQTDVVDERVAETTVASAAEPVAVPLELPGAGVYVVELEARDRLGRAQTVAVDLYAGGEEPLAWAKPVAGVFTAAPDRREYAPGETASIVLASPFQSGRALAVVEAPEGNRYGWVEVRGGAATFALPVLETFAPRVAVHFLLFRGRVPGTEPLPGGGADLGRPQTVAATAWLAVRPVANRVEVALEHPERARPGEEIAIRVRLADPAGAPLAGEVTLWLVDQAVLALAREQRLDPLPDLVPDVRSHLAARDTRNLVFGTIPLAERPGGEAARAAEEALDLVDRATVRRTFATVPYYEPALAVGPDGVAEVRVRLPDNLTNFKVRAKAASGAGRFGFATGQVAVRLPLVVQPALPRFVRPGDAFDAAAVARVVEGPGGAARAQLRVEGAELRGPGATELALEPNRPSRFSAAVAVPTPAYAASGEPPPAEIVVRGGVERAADGARDAFEVRLPVRDDRDRVRAREIVELAPGGAATVAAIPETARPGTVRRRLLVSDQPALVKMAAGLDFLAGYPYGCTEQRVSEARAHLALARFRDVLALPGGEAAAADAVRSTLAFLPAVVGGDGLAAYWPGGPGYVSLTAWVVRFLAEAQRAGHPVDPKLLEGTTRALEQALRSDYPRFVDGEAFTERALALGALAAAGRFNPAYAAELARQAQFLSLEGTSEVLLALAGAGGAPAGTIGDLAARVAGGAATRLWQGREVYAGLREDWSGRNPLVLPGETATVAAMAEALAQAGAEPQRRRILLDALVRLGTGDGWGSTRANAAALLALAGSRPPPAAGASPRTVEVRAGGRSATVATDARRPAGTHVTAAEGPLELTLRPGASGAALVRVDTEYVPAAPGSAVAPEAAGFVVSRELLLVRPDGAAPELIPLDAPGREVRLAVGDVVEERVRVVNPADRTFVAVVVPLAAGVEPLNPALETAPPEARPEGATTLAPTWAAYLDDAASFYYDRLPKGTYEFAFRTRATTPGRFVQPPARAELMYDGTVRGRGAGAAVTVGAP